MRLETPKYQQLAAQTQKLLEANGQVGTRLLSLRDFAAREQVSISTAMRVYEELERNGVVESRNRTGYFICATAAPLAALPTASTKIPVVRTEKTLLEDLASSAWQAHKFAAYFAGGASDTTLAGARELSRMIRRTARRDLENYGPVAGDPLLRQEISNRAIRQGIETLADDLVITFGAQEALFIALNVSTKPGDLVAVESPTYHGVISALALSGRKILEIPTDAQSGINLAALELALQELKVKAVVVSSCAQNPLGCSMQDDDKQALVALANQYKITLIDDDTHGDLCYSPHRARNLRAFDTQDRVICCGSFSKTLAPELRVGWLDSARWNAQAQEFKRAISQRSALMSAQAIARHMAEGHYHRHIRLARNVYAKRARAMGADIAQFFPRGSCISQPTGGFQLWVELPESYSAMALTEYALSQDIAIAPGKLFSHRGHYSHCLRLCYACYLAPQRAALELLGSWLAQSK